MTTIRLFVSSDYVMTRDGIRALLESRAEDIHVVDESTTADAAGKVHTAAADVVLVDASAPASHAMESVGRLVREASDARIVVLTNIENAPFVRSMLAVGAIGLVLKHSETDQLIRAIRKAATSERFIDPSLSDVIAGEFLPQKRKAPMAHLSRREQEVLGGIARGLTNRQLADRLRLSTKTVETYRGRLYHKLHLHDRAELVNYAIGVGLLSRMRAD